jgi:effector-binding domain-containing protein
MFVVPKCWSQEVVQFKQIATQNLLVVEYKGEGNIAPYFGELVAYYNRDKKPFEIVFPQMTVEFSSNNQWIAIGYIGEAYETEHIKLKQLPSVTVATAMHKGSYQTIGNTIRDLYAQLRLLYHNSPDNTQPSELLTEVQVPVQLADN